MSKKKLQKKKYKYVYMCGIAFQHDLDEDSADYVKVYASERALKNDCSCYKECGIVKVKINLEEWTVRQNIYAS